MIWVIGSDTDVARSSIDLIGEKKPKTKWPKSTEEAEYKKFDNEVSDLIQMKKQTL